MRGPRSFVQQMSAATTLPSRSQCDSIGDHVCDVDVGWRHALLVAAQRLLTFIGGHVDAERLEELVVDVARAAVMWSDKDHDGVVVVRPHSEEAIIAVEVPAAHVLQLGAREPVSSGLAASVLQLTDRAERGGPTRTAEISDLAVGDGRQRDVGRGFSRRRSSAISLRRSSLNGTTRPARRSANPSSEPSSATRSLTTRIT